jgi:Zn finger protein HypA/HybF involved in hydrogenase expression
MGAVTDLVRTLDQELLALTRGASLECLVCGEFVLHRAGGVIACPECGAELRDGEAAAGALHSSMQAG